MKGELTNADKYENAMQKMGFGHFQKKIVLLLTLSSVPNGYFAMIVVFVARTPHYECYVPDLNNNNSVTALPDVTQRIRMYQKTIADSRTEAIIKTELDESNCIGPSNLSIYNGSAAYNNSSVKSCPFGVKYDFEPGRSSIVTEWDLVCENAWILPLVLATYMVGVLIGSVLTGILADRYGRRPPFLVGTLLMFILLALCGVSTSPAMFGVILFFAGLFAYINYSTAVIIAAEIVYSKNRVVSCTLAVGGFAFGYMLLPLFAYFIPNWRTLCFALGSLGVLYIPYIWLIPESPRWLLTKGRTTEFLKLFKKMASENRCTPEQTSLMIAELGDGKDGHCVSVSVASIAVTFFVREGINQDDPAEAKLLAGITDERDSSIEITDSRHEFNFFDLLRLSVVRSRTMVMWFIWFVCAVVYYGLSFNTSNIGGDPYINCFVAAAVEIPAYAMVILLLKYQGRKTILIGSLAIAGLTCTCVPFLAKSSNATSIVFAMIGKFAVSGSFNIIYIVCPELFPTLLRGMSLGSSSVAARLGGIVAPYLLYLGESYYSAPYIVMGTLAVFSCLCVTMLPETKDSSLPDTEDDLAPLEFISFGCLNKRRKPESIDIKESEIHC